MSCIGKLFCRDEQEIDSLIVSGAVSIAGLVIFQAVQVFHDPASFNAITFGGASATLISALGGSHWMRDGQGHRSDDKPDEDHHDH